MRERRPWRAAMPRGLLGMVALVAAVEGFVACRTDWVDPGGLEWRFGDRAAWKKAPGAAVICVGGSQMRFGLAPQELEARLGRPVRSLALTAAPPTVAYLLLRHAIAAGARPEALLIDFSPFLLVRGPRHVAARLPEVAGLGDCLDLGRGTRDPELFASVALARLLPSLGNREGLRSRLRRAVGLAADAPAEREQGNPEARKAKWRPGGDARIHEVVYPDPWRCPGVNVDYVRRTLDLAAARGIAVYWLIPPCAADVLAERERRGLEGQYTRFARAILAGRPGVTVIDGRRLDYGDEAYHDPVHLNRRGASAFTAEVAAVLRDHPPAARAGPRWLELPPRAGGPVAVARRDEAPMVSIPSGDRRATR